MTALLLVRHCESSGPHPEAPLTGTGLRQARGRAAVDWIAALRPRCAVIVSHGNLIGLVLNSLDPRFDFAAWEKLTNPDVYSLRPSAGGYAISRRWSP